MSYGTIKVDTITFTDNSVDKSVSLSGLIQNPTFTGNITVTGTISGDVIRGGTTVSGATVTGTTANFVSGVFTTQISGATVTGTTASFTSGVFTNISGTTATITSGIIASGTAAAPSLAILADLDTGLFSPGANQLAVATNGVGRLFVDSTGKVGIGSPSSLNSFEINTAGTPLSVNSTNGGQNKIILRTNGAAEGYFGTTSTALLTASDGSGSERLRITSAGLVGIGTSAPADILHIGGSSNQQIRVNGSGAPIYIGSANSILNLAVNRRTSDGAIPDATKSAAYINLDGSGSSSEISFLTASAINTQPTVKAVIDGSGRVGIGTTTPGEMLHVNGNIRVPWNLSSIAAYSSDQYNQTINFRGDDRELRISSIADNLNPSITFVTGTNPGSERFRCDSSGRLLVGTSTSRAVQDFTGNGASRWYSRCRSSRHFKPRKA
jgi:hypothetical protein